MLDLHYQMEDSLNSQETKRILTQQQRLLSKAIKRARYMGLIEYTSATV